MKTTEEIAVIREQKNELSKEDISCDVANRICDIKKGVNLAAGRKREATRGEPVTAFRG